MATTTANEAAAMPAPRTIIIPPEVESAWESIVTHTWDIARLTFSSYLPPAVVVSDDNDDEAGVRRSGPPRSCEVDESKMSLPGRSKQAKEEEEEGRR